MERDESLISVLQDIQAEYGYLPEEKLIETAKTLDMPLIDVYGVATSYKSFRLIPKSRHQVKVCTGCHVGGGDRIVEEIARKLGIRPGETSEDGKLSLETVMCFGLGCSGVVVMVDRKYYFRVTLPKVKSILKRF
ncbi:NADP-reducing hydrogenase subunit HndA [subsurface metagenome]